MHTTVVNLIRACVISAAIMFGAPSPPPPDFRKAGLELRNQAALFAAAVLVMRVIVPAVIGQYYARR